MWTFPVFKQIGNIFLNMQHKMQTVVHTDALHAPPSTLTTRSLDDVCSYTGMQHFIDWVQSSYRSKMYFIKCKANY